MPSANAYWFVCPTRSAERPKIVAFRDWLLSEVERGSDFCPEQPGA